MTQDKSHNGAIKELLDMAPKAPASPQLAEQILASALLDKAPDVPASPQLQQNILAKAGADYSDEKIVTFTPKSSNRPPLNWLSDNALAGGLMAASLLLGFWIGTNGIADGLISAPLEIAGIQTSETEDIFNLYGVIDSLMSQESLL